MAQLEMTVERRDYSEMSRKRTSWSAIFAGSFIAIAVMLLLSTLGIAVGATTIDPIAGESPSMVSLSIGGAIWWVVSGAIAFFLGGVAAGRFAGLRRRWEGPMHGIVTWAVVTVLLAMLASSLIGGLLGGTLQVVGDAAEVAAAAPPSGGEGTDQAARDPQLRADGPRLAKTVVSLITAVAGVSFAYLLFTALAAALGGMLGAPRSRETASAEGTRASGAKSHPRVPPSQREPSSGQSHLEDVLGPPSERP
jgi:hypothetical protein